MDLLTALLIHQLGKPVQVSLLVAGARSCSRAHAWERAGRCPPATLRWERVTPPETSGEGCRGFLPTSPSGRDEEKEVECAPGTYGAGGACDRVLLTGCSIINRDLAAGKGPEHRSHHLPANPAAPLPPAPDPPGPMQKPAMMPATQATLT